MLVSRGRALWNLGFPDQALALTREAVTLCEDADDRYTYCSVLQWAGLNYFNCGDMASAEDQFRKALNLGNERGFPQIVSTNTMLLGLVSASCGQVQAGLDQLRRGTEVFDASSAATKLVPPRIGLTLALVYELAGRPEEAFAALIPAIEAAEQSGAEAGLAVMHALKGRLLDGKSNSAEAEKSFLLQSKLHIVRSRNRLSCVRR